MRVDFTNLLEYWGDVTDTPARKRSVEEEHMPYKDWKAKVKSAKKSHRELRKRQKDVLSSSQIMERDETQDTGVGKRWFGAELTEPDQGYVESKIVSFEDGKISYLPGPILQPTSNYSMPLFRRDDAGSESIDDGEAPDFSLANSFTCPATTCTATDGTESGAKRRAIAACPSTLPDFKSEHSRITLYRLVILADFK